MRIHGFRVARLRPRIFPESSDPEKVLAVRELPPVRMMLAGLAAMAGTAPRAIPVVFDMVAAMVASLAGMGGSFRGMMG